MMKALLSFLCITAAIGIANAQGILLPKKNNPIVLSDTLATPNSSKSPKVGDFIIPAVFVGYGIVSISNPTIRNLDDHIRSEIRGHHPNFRNHLDDYIQFAPAVAVYGLNIAGIKGKNKVLDASIIYGISLMLMGGSVSIIKNNSDRLRPDGSDYRSFPSGHTATAFVGAEFIRQEYKDVSPWYGIAGYAVATTTGIFRMYNNKHWFSDVVAGVGFGIISTKLAYITYPYLKRKFCHNRPMKFMLTPTYQNRSLVILFLKQF